MLYPWLKGVSQPAIIYLLPQSSTEPPTFTDLPHLRETEIKKIVLKFTLPSGQIFQSLANQLATAAFHSREVIDPWQSPVKNRRWPSAFGSNRGKKGDKMTLPGPFIYFWFIFLRDRGRGRKREREREGERNIDLSLHLFMHSLVVSCMCPDLGSNLQPWCIGTTL